jgi:hypothetical protein
LLGSQPWKRTRMPWPCETLRSGLGVPGDEEYLVRRLFLADLPEIGEKMLLLAVIARGLGWAAEL